MNYLLQILAFDDFLLYKSKLSAGQIALWRALMSINNKAQWKEWFTAANTTIESLSGLSRSGINKNRNALKQLGLIDFKSNGRKATSYKVCVLYTSKSTQESEQQSTQQSEQDGTQESEQQSGTFLNLNTNSNLNGSSTPATPNNINNAPTRESVTEKITQEFGRRLSPMELKYLDGLFQGASPVLVECALQEAVLHQAYSFKYIASVLNAFKKRGITNREQYEQTVQERNKQNQSNQQKAPADGPDIPLFSITGEV